MRTVIIKTLINKQNGTAHVSPEALGGGMLQKSKTFPSAFSTELAAYVKQLENEYRFAGCRVLGVELSLNPGGE